MDWHQAQSASMDIPKEIRDVADARHEALVSGVREYYAMTEARLAEMEPA